METSLRLQKPTVSIEEEILMMKNNDKTTIYVIRHGESEENAHAWNDLNTPFENGSELGSQLTEKGKEQARAVSKKLKDLNLAAIFSSDLLRAKETAEIVAKPHGLSVVTNSTIRERNWGAKMSQIVRLEVEEALKDLNDEERLVHRYFPDGESGLEAIKRLTDFLEEIAPAYNQQTIAVVNHGNIMRSFLVKLGFATYDELPSGSIENTAYFVLETDEKTYKIKETNGIYKNVRKDDEE
jgi:broad specificity phosphatase PhoE